MFGLFVYKDGVAATSSQLSVNKIEMTLEGVLQNVEDLIIGGGSTVMLRYVILKLHQRFFNCFFCQLFCTKLH